MNVTRERKRGWDGGWGVLKKSRKEEKKRSWGKYGNTMKQAHRFINE